MRSRTQVGSCPQARQKMAELGGKERYMVWHMARLARYIKSKSPHTNVLIWHDMIVNMNQADLIREANFTTLVEPVVWMYAENLDMYLQPFVWESLKVRIS
jgi:hypothetical protein